MTTTRKLVYALTLPGLFLIGCGGAPEQDGGRSAAPADEAAEPDRLPEPMTAERPMLPEPTIETAVDCTRPPATRNEQVCWRWRCDRMDLGEGTWSGNVASCTAGDISAAGRSNALRLVNLYRFIAQLPAVTNDTTKSSAAQQCALMMHANGTLNHTPPTTWKCYTATGAGSAGKSNIATTAGVKAVDLYMADPGNPTTIGHRRWILSNSLGPIGLGSTSAYSCMQVIGGAGAAGKAWVAWPPPGPVPIEMFTAVSFAPLDSVGWTVQSDSLNLTNAKATVKEGATILAFTTVNLGSGYGSKYGIRFYANNTAWRAKAGATYSVTVSGGSLTTPISYTFTPTVCP